MECKVRKPNFDSLERNFIVSRSRVLECSHKTAIHSKCTWGDWWISDLQRYYKGIFDYYKERTCVERSYGNIHQEDSNSD